MSCESLITSLATGRFRPMGDDNATDIRWSFFLQAWKGSCAVVTPVLILRAKSGFENVWYHFLQQLRTEPILSSSFLHCKSRNTAHGLVWSFSSASPVWRLLSTMYNYEIAFFLGRETDWVNLTSLVHQNIIWKCH